MTPKLLNNANLLLTNKMLFGFLPDPLKCRSNLHDQAIFVKTSIGFYSDSGKCRCGEIGNGKVGEMRIEI